MVVVRSFVRSSVCLSVTDVSWLTGRSWEKLLARIIGGAENGGHENGGPSKCPGMNLTKCPYMKLADIFFGPTRMQSIITISHSVPVDV